MRSSSALRPGSAHCAEASSAFREKRSANPRIASQPMITPRGTRGRPDRRRRARRAARRRAPSRRQPLVDDVGVPSTRCPCTSKTLVTSAGCCTGPRRSPSGGLSPRKRPVHALPKPRMSKLGDAAGTSARRPRGRSGSRSSSAPCAGPERLPFQYGGSPEELGAILLRHVQRRVLRSESASRSISRSVPMSRARRDYRADQRLVRFPAICSSGGSDRRVLERRAERLRCAQGGGSPSVCVKTLVYQRARSSRARARGEHACL